MAQGWTWWDQGFERGQVPERETGRHLCSVQDDRAADVSIDAKVWSKMFSQGEGTLGQRQTNLYG